jgi:uncharacterized membrane protein YdbT with pleckstrin-like domain
MGYPPELLSEGETIELEMRPHWRALLMPILITIVDIVVVVWITTQWANWFSGTVGTVGRWVFLGGGLLFIIMFAVKPLIYWYSTLYVFTDRRIIIRTGFIAREGRDMPLSKVQNVSFQVSVSGRLLNYGTLRIDSASDEELVINDVPNVERIQREVNMLHEEDDARRRRDLGSADT